MRKFIVHALVMTVLVQLTCWQTTLLAAEKREVIDISGHPVKGPDSATVTIIVFSDYLCPVCSKLEPVLHKVLEKYPHDVKLVHKLCPIHDFSKEAISAAYAAWDQGKFWEYHDLLFNNQLVLNEPKIVAMAKELNLDLKRFNDKREDPAIEKLIDKDWLDVGRLSLKGTPTVYVNGKVLGSRSFESFQTAIERELKDKTIQDESRPDKLNPRR